MILGTAPAILLGACAAKTAPHVAGPPGSAAVVEIVVMGYRFPAMAATPGGAIHLSDGDAEPHTVTADDSAFRAGPFGPMSSAVLIAPAAPGTYPFHCEIHPTMHGDLIVHTP